MTEQKEPRHPYGGKEFKPVIVEPALKSVVFEITPRCNQRCIFCYDRQGSSMPHPPFKQITSTLENLFFQGVERYHFLGGEPTIFPRFLELIEMMHKKGCKLSIASNGLISPKRIKKISKFIDTVYITILGPDKKTHNSLALTDGFSKTVRSLKEFQKCGLETRSYFTATSQNYSKTTATMEFLTHQNIDVINVNRFIPAAQGLKNRYLMLDLQQLNSVLNDMHVFSKDTNIKTTMVQPPPLCLVHSEVWRLLSPCRAGIDIGCIDWAGNVKHCDFSFWVLGNIKESALDDIWNSSIMQKYRCLSWIPQKCKNCKELSKCGIGCRVSSSWLQQKPFGADIYIADTVNA